MKYSERLFRVALFCIVVFTSSFKVLANPITAFTQDFTGDSTNPQDYGFTIASSSTADGMSVSVSEGKLVTVCGNYGNASKGYTLDAPFSEIGEGNVVTFSCNWSTGNATGYETQSYSELDLTDGTNTILSITNYGQPKTMYINGTQIASNVDRDQTYTVTATLDMSKKEITSLSIGSLYTATSPIAFYSTDATTLTTFTFKHYARATWTNTSSIDDVSITYEKIVEEDIASVAIVGADKMTFGDNHNTAYSNPYAVTITGENGTIFTENNLDDFTVTWDIEGFKTTNDTEGQYCDSYGAFSVNNQEKTSTTFDLRNVPMNFFGKMMATVNFNGKTFKAEKYVVAQGDLSKATNQVLPLAGYPKSLSVYPDALVGYKIADETYGAASDLIIGGWCEAGSDTPSATIGKDNDGTKFARLMASTLKKSHVLTNTIATPTSQLIFKNRLRFNHTGGVVTLTSRYPFWSSDTGYTNPVTLNLDGTNIKLNGTALTKDDAPVQFATGTWYDVVLSVDKTNETCYALVYNTNGTLLAESGNIAWTETSNPTYFSVGMGNSNIGSIDMASYEAFIPEADANSYLLTADKTTLSIPNKETATLTATLADVNGYAITQKATWTVVEEDMQEAVIITLDENDSHKATIALAETAEAGTVTIQVNIGGVTKTIELTLTSSAESVKFTKSTTSITIPLDANETATAEFAAIVVNGQGVDLGRNVSLAAFQKDGTTPYENTDAISFDAVSGVLSVKSAASPTQLVITATGQNSNNETLTKSVRVNIHGMKFDFGMTTEEAIADGFTVVGPTTTYNATAGYGIKSGMPTVGGTASATDATKDYLEGAIEFDFKATKGAFYTVEITYQGTLTTGYINSDLAGYELGSSTTMTTATFTIPATTDVIDLRVADNGDAKARIAQITVTKQAKRQKRGKRVVHHIGDSTSANNGSWAYRLKNLVSETYPELAALCDFHNDGAGGRNLSTYYTEGKLASVLRDIYPGDIVMFGNNGTNGMGSSFETDVNYYLDAAETLGAKVILNSYTPHGAVAKYASGYNSTSHTFDSYREDSYDQTMRAIAEERATNDPNYLGFVEIGKNADATFNAFVADYAKNGYASADAAAQAIIACFTDHNHYSNGVLACDLMLNGYSDVKGIVAQLQDILTPNQKTISAWGWNTYSSKQDVQFGEGTTAYIVTAIDNDHATLKQVKAIPAHTGVLITGNANEAAQISYASDAVDDITGNQLISTAMGANTISSGYVLSATKESHSLGFYSISSETTIPQYSAFLPAASGSRTMLVFAFGDDAPTGITDMNRQQATGSQGLYDMLGRRVSNTPRKGVYIDRATGKKIFIK